VHDARASPGSSAGSVEPNSSTDGGGLLGEKKTPAEPWNQTGNERTKRGADPPARSVLEISAIPQRELARSSRSWRPGLYYGW
jgi:hypothetical protein